MLKHSSDHGTLWLHNDGDELYHYILYYWKYKYPSTYVCNTEMTIKINLFKVWE